MLRQSFIAALVLLSGTAFAEDRTPTLSLTGTGIIDRAPDIATIRVGVNTAAKTARAALDENTANATEVINSLKAAGITERDIQTSDFDIQPVYKDHKRISSSGDESPVDFYRVTNMVTAVIRDLNGVGAVLDKVITAGGNQVNGISFGLSTYDAALDEARGLAVADARRKAELYAKAAGVTLGPILTISEAGGHMGPRAEIAMARVASAPVPIQGGELSVAASVSIVWQIAD